MSSNNSKPSSGPSTEGGGSIQTKKGRKTTKRKKSVDSSPAAAKKKVTTTRRRRRDTEEKKAPPKEQQEQEQEESNPLESSLIPEGTLPSYLADAFGELYEEDGLIVFGKGLGWLSLLASFVRFYADVEEGHVAVMIEDKRLKLPPGGGSTDNIRPPLVFVIGLKEAERNTLLSVLETWGTPPELLPTIITNESGQGRDRAVMYQRGGVFCITSRILIVDLLTNVAIANQIDGFLVAHAETVVEESTEAFILRIFHSQKQQNQQEQRNQLTGADNNNNNTPTITSKLGFCKGFCDVPDQLVSGFAKIDKIMKAMRVRRLFLYPRFHYAVQKELEAFSPHVDELYQPLSPKMKEIQNALAAAVQSVIRELKSTTTLLEWSSSSSDTNDHNKSKKGSSHHNKEATADDNKNELLLSIENIVTSNFDYSISKQLEHDWHRLKPVTKQLIQDLRTLRTLFQSLIQYDCISFWKLINSIKTMSAASKYPSMWLLTPAADVLFRKAKERIYTIIDCYDYNNHSSSKEKKEEQQQQGQGTTKKPPPMVTKRLKPILEEMPKWRLLKKILMEISQEEKTKREEQNVNQKEQQHENEKETTSQNNNNDESNKKLPSKPLEKNNKVAGSTAAAAVTAASETTTTSTTASSSNNHFNSNKFQPTNVLVMVKDDKTLEGIQSYLVDGKKYTMGKRWLRYLDHCNDRLRNIVDSRGGISSVSEESRLLIEEEGRIRNLLFGGSNRPNKKKRHRGGGTTNYSNNNNNNNEKPPLKQKKPYIVNKVPTYMKKRRRIAAERGRGTLMHQADDIEREAVLYEALDQTEYELQGEEENEGEERRSGVAASGSIEEEEGDPEQEDDEEEPKEEAPNHEDTFLSYAAAAEEEAAAAAAGNNKNKGEEDDIDDIMFDVKLPCNELRVVLKSYSDVNGGANGGGDDHALLLLQDLRPKYIILYDADVSFVRSIEIYSSLHSPTTGTVPDDDPKKKKKKKKKKNDNKEEKGPTQQQDQRVRVFFFIFEASSEEKVFMKTLEREQKAFEKLIHHKKTMPPPVWQNTSTTQELLYAQERGMSIGGTYCGGTLPLAFDTRTGRGKQKITFTKSGRDIAVDVREFRSALPSILHQGGMRLAPVTLTVGDFVLSTVHCIERKSIGDLFGSFNSGRLYVQAEAMCKHYKCPCLLIEFDPNKSFCLQNSNELGVEIRTDSICSKMALLTMHFPKLRILWSRSPHHTLRIFKELKTNHGEVDVTKAVDIGRTESIHNEEDEAKDDKDGDDDDEEEDEVNEMAREMLMRLPGVNVHSARRIMQQCDSLAELSEMSRMDLRKIAGPVTGQKLFTFFRQKMAAT